MNQNEIVIVRRDIDALMIPSAASITLLRGTEVMITQALGSSYTVNVYGNLARVDGKDADALGKTVVMPEDIHDDRSLDEKIGAQLKTCYDPEIPVNIVDLGLIYDCKVTALNAGQHRVDIRMTLTAPGCGMGPVLAAEAKQKVLGVSGVSEVNIDIVFDPLWDRDKMSDAAKLALGLL